jgi:hypothetical protein
MTRFERKIFIQINNEIKRMKLKIPNKNLSKVS